MLEDFQGDSWGSIPPLRMSSLLPHDLCHGRSASCRPPTMWFRFLKGHSGSSVTYKETRGDEGKSVGGGCIIRWEDSFGFDQLLAVEMEESGQIVIIFEDIATRICRWTRKRVWIKERNTGWLPGLGPGQLGEWDCHLLRRWKSREDLTGYCYVSYSLTATVGFFFPLLVFVLNAVAEPLTWTFFFFSSLKCDK